MKPYIKRTGLFTLISLICVIQSSTVYSKSQEIDSIMRNDEFNENLKKKYESYINIPKEMLILDLNDLLEDMLPGGSHVMTASRKSKIRKLNKFLHMKIRGELCNENNRIHSSQNETIYYLVRGIKAFIDNEGLKLRSNQYGTLAGTLLGIIDKSKPDDLCLGNSFKK